MASSTPRDDIGQYMLAGAAAGGPEANRHGRIEIPLIFQMVLASR